MRQQNKLIFFNNVVYALSKDYGFPCALYRVTEETNLQTGRKTLTRAKYPIKKAIFFPSDLFRDYNYANLFGKSLQYGGIVDVTQRHILINQKYLPKGFIIDTNDYMIFDSHRYEIQKVDEMELADYWHLVTKKVTGTPKSETFDRKIKDRLIPEELFEWSP